MSSKDPKNKLAFLSMPAPASYVAGLGRGASGFTTRSDIGPAREGPSEEVIAEARAKRGEEEQPDPEQFQDPDNEYGLFAGMTYEADDEEADRIYERVDDAMDSRRKARREALEQSELSKHRLERPKIQQQFADLKRGLSSVTDSEWENIPEVGNLTRRKKRRGENDRTYVVPDSVIVGDRSKSEYESSLEVDPGAQGDAPGTMTNFVEIGQARDKLLSIKLDQLSSSISSTSSAGSGLSTSIDPKGYLTSLSSIQIKSDAEIGDIKRARMLFDSLNNDDAKVILANAVQHVGQSVKIWLAAADLEHDVKAKKRVLRKALEHIPTSVRLWKETVNLETSSSDARILLARAVEVIPTSVDLWLALARLETPDKAKSVLNKARKSVPTSHEIWIAAGRLVEQEACRSLSDKGGNGQGEGGGEGKKEPSAKELEAIDKTISMGVKELRRHQVLLTRDQWLSQAESCESSGSPRTCEAIIKATLSMDLEDEDDETKYTTWTSDAQNALGRGRVGTARAILAYTLKFFPNRQELWRTSASLEKAHGTPASLDALLSKAVEYVPSAEVLWLMRAKERWMRGEVDGAREVLVKAFDTNPESEQIWLAAVKLEAESGELGVARELLGRARGVADTERIWMKSAVFERQQRQYTTALQTLSTAIQKFPKFAKLYMIQGQIYLHNLQNIPAARTAFSNGIKACPKEPTLWILASRLEEQDGKSIKARAILEKGRLAVPKDDKLWAESVRVEERSSSNNTASGSTNANSNAKSMLARALQECPTSGLLWSISILTEPRPTRKSRSVDALKKAPEDPLIICTVARLFWAERKIEKAREWFRRAVKADGDVGDVWGWWLKFEKQHGGGGGGGGNKGEEDWRDVVKRECEVAEPRHGEVWQSVSKDDRNVGKRVGEVLELVCEALV
ncbi:hypothetical protein MD484_g3518, partial [Candolleomyces efflorescens]